MDANDLAVDAPKKNRINKQTKVGMGPPTKVGILAVFWSF